MESTSIPSLESTSLPLLESTSLPALESPSMESQESPSPDFIDEYTTKMIWGKIHPEALTPVNNIAFYPFIQLKTPRDFVIKAHSSKYIGLGFYIQPPTGTYGHILHLRDDKKVDDTLVTVGAGVLHGGSSEEVSVLLFNHSEQEVKFSKGDSIAGLIIKEIQETELEEVIDEDLPSTARGDKGFGSSGT